MALNFNFKKALSLVQKPYSWDRDHKLTKVVFFLGQKTINILANQQGCIVARQCAPGNYGTQEVLVIFSHSADKTKELRVRKRLL